MNHTRRCATFLILNHNQSRCTGMVARETGMVAGESCSDHMGGHLGFIESIFAEMGPNLGGLGNIDTLRGNH